MINASLEWLIEPTWLWRLTNLFPLLCDIYICLCVFVLLRCQSRRGDLSSLIGLVNLIETSYIPWPSLPSLSTFNILVMHSLLTPSIYKTLTWIQPYYKFRLVFETHCVYCRVIFKVICNVLECSHSKIHLFHKHSLSSAMIFHLQNINFTLTTGTFCVPCSCSFY